MTAADRLVVVTSVDELRQFIGKQTRVGDWHLVTQAEIDAFADATGDHQWIHVDPERARGGPFGGTIAHGFWTLSSAPFILHGGSGGDGIEVRLPSRMGVNYGLNRVRFMNPVRVGKRIRVLSRLLSVDEIQPGMIQQVNELTVEIEGESKPAMVAESVSRMYLHQPT
jgi:acyl dehydratase